MKKMRFFPFIIVASLLVFLGVPLAAFACSPSQTAKYSDGNLIIDDGITTLVCFIVFLLADICILLYFLSRETRKPSYVIAIVCTAFAVGGLFLSLAASDFSQSINLSSWLKRLYDMDSWSNDSLFHLPSTASTASGYISYTAEKYRNHGLLFLFLASIFHVPALVMAIFIKPSSSKQISDSTHSCLNQNSLGTLQLTDCCGTHSPVQICSGQMVNVGTDQRTCSIIVDQSMTGVSPTHLSVCFDYQTQQYFVTNLSSIGTFLLPNRVCLPRNITQQIPRGSALQLSMENCFLLLL